LCVLFASCCDGHIELDYSSLFRNNRTRTHHECAGIAAECGVRIFQPLGDAE
jgi:hypothetical protein